MSDILYVHPELV